MAKRGFSISEALGEGFRMAGQRPLSVWVWGLIVLLPVAAQLGFMTGALLDVPFATFTDAAASDNEAAMQEALVPLLVQMQLGDAFALVIRILGGAVLAAAIYRVVLQPGLAGRRPFALGLGMPELRVGVTYVVVISALAIGAACLILMMVGVGLGSWSRLTDGGQGWMATVLVFVVLLAILAAYARVCLIPPSCVADDDFAFETGWRRGAGQTGRLALMTLMLWVLTLVISLTAYAVIWLIGWGLWSALGLGGDWPQDLASLREVMLHDPRILWLAGALMIPLTWVYGLQMVLNLAPYASAVRQLTPEPAADAPVSGDESEF